MILCLAYGYKMLLIIFNSFNWSECLCPHVEPSKVLMALIHFLIYFLSSSLLILESAKFTLHMTFIFQVFLKKPRKCGICFYTGIWSCFSGGRSLCDAILTEFIQQITHRNELSALLGQHEINNFCNLSRLILKKRSSTSVLTIHKQNNFPTEKNILG